MQSSHLVASFLAAGPELGAVSWQLPAAGRIRIPQRGICSAAPAAVSWFGTTGLEPLVLLSGMALGLAMICWPVVAFEVANRGLDFGAPDEQNCAGPRQKSRFEDPRSAQSESHPRWRFGCALRRSRPAAQPASKAKRRPLSC